MKVKGKFIKLDYGELMSKEKYNSLIRRGMLRYHKEQILYKMYEQLCNIADEVVTERSVSSPIESIALEFKAFVEVKPKKQKKGEKRNE